VHEDEGPLPFVVAALEQSAGRGRQGRAWLSPAGSGLCASMVLPVPSPERLQELPTAARWPLCRRQRGRRLSDQWPNDLVV
jgi:BirA family biotin operon repressor/biotin-[acetyl-CoA-carboxylase] ligase